MSIYVGGPKTDYSAMQGPCDSGFHIPSLAEWIYVNNVGISLGVWSSSASAGLSTMLKLPFCGMRGTDGNVAQQGSIGGYWCSSINNANAAHYFRFISNQQVFTNSPISVGYCVRAFKDVVVNPIDSGSTLKSGWTWTYHSGSNNYGIAYNSTLGLISLSSNGTTRYTIQDKNLGATTVWNSGDILSQANCGKYYQRGNNYGFPRTGSVTKSSTAVNASTYGPGNYYSSSTFITASPRDSSNNLNLRGGVTGVVQATGEIKNIYVGTTPVKEVYVGTTKVRPTFSFKTFTISWTEQSNMSSGWTYSDDATGLTAGSTAFDEFFGYSAVRLSSAGVETAEVAQSSPGVLDITQLGTLTSGDNVMIKFPILGIKMSKSGSTVTLSITDNPDAEADGFQYYAHSRGTLSSPIKKDTLYLGAYKAYNNSNVLKSWSGRSPTGYITQQLSINYARANDGNSGSAGYDIIGFYQRQFVNALYMMKYGNPNSQSIVGNGYIGGSATQNTGGTNSQTNATYGTSGTGDRVKLFGLEDWRGNVTEWVGGVCEDGSKRLWTALSGFVGNVTTSSPYENTGITIQGSGYPFILSSIVGNNKGLFAPLNTSSTSNTYYCDYTPVSSSAGVLDAGGSGSNGSDAGAFYLAFGVSAGNTNRTRCNRIMYL